MRPGTSEISMKSEKLPSVYTLNFTATGYTDGNSIKINLNLAASNLTERNAEELYKMKEFYRQK